MRRAAVLSAALQAVSAWREWVRQPYLCAREGRPGITLRTGPDGGEAAHPTAARATVAIGRRLQQVQLQY